MAVGVAYTPTTRQQRFVFTVKAEKLMRSVSPPDLPTKDGILQCRICGSEMIVMRGEVELYCGYALPIYDCDDCGCRFAPHDSSVYELLYSEQNSRYGHYIDYARSCKTHFEHPGDYFTLNSNQLRDRTLSYQFYIRVI